jgi:hypothetical protein
MPKKKKKKITTVGTNITTYKYNVVGLFLFAIDDI